MGLISTKEAAGILGIDASTLKVWIKNKKINIPHYQLGPMIKFKKEEVNSFFQSCRVDPEQQQAVSK